MLRPVRTVLMVAVILLLVSVSSTASASASRVANDAVVLHLPTALSYPHLPIFTPDGGMVVVSPVNPAPLSYPPVTGLDVAPAAVMIAWIDKHGRTTFSRTVRLGGDVQSVYAVTARKVWLLLARPELTYDTTTPRHYSFATLDAKGNSKDVTPGDVAPWPTQTRAANSLGGIWVATGVFWTYSTFQSPYEDGLNWADLHGHWAPPGSLDGGVDYKLLPGRGSSLWALVSQTESGTQAPTTNAVFRFDVSRIPPQPRSYTLTPGSPVGDFAEGADDGFWFGFDDGRLGRVDRFGSLAATYRWRPPLSRGESLSGRPVDIETAPDHGVWVINEDTVEHFTTVGRVARFKMPPAWRQLGDDWPNRYRAPTVTMSPCGVIWLRRITSAFNTSELSSWRVPGAAQKGCLDASVIRAGK